MTAAASPAVDESPGPSDLDRAENVKHLELIQTVVNRLAANSFLIKGWALTVAAAAYGFAVNRIDWRVALAGSTIVVGFWLLDAYCLRQERLFRHLYDHVRLNISCDERDRFSMDLRPFLGLDNVKRLSVFFSVTLLVFYLLLVAVGVLISVFAAVVDPVGTQVVR